jgi:hypothetical protein
VSADKVLQFPGTEPHEYRPARGDRLLAALIILTHGGVQIARIAAYAVVLLLAAIGALSLIGR